MKKKYITENQLVMIISLKLLLVQYDFKNFFDVDIHPY